MEDARVKLLDPGTNGGGVGGTVVDSGLLVIALAVEVGWAKRRGGWIETYSFRRVTSLVLVEWELDLLGEVDDIRCCLLGCEVLQSLGVKAIVGR